MVALKQIKEGDVVIYAYTGNKISKKLPVFYNPTMELNRSISILFIKSLKRDNLRICLPLAASGIRGIRFLVELPKETIKSIVMNDINPEAVKIIKENLLNNKVKRDGVLVTNSDANLILIKSKGFDYIDIDPFGSPVDFIDAAIKRISRNGFIAVTATDTATLCGTSVKSCLRRYSSKPLKNEFCHEIGLRILINKIQRIGCQYNKALIPLLSYSKDHYFRVFFHSRKGKRECDKLIDSFGYLIYCDSCLFRKTTNTIFNETVCPECKKNLKYAGPLWLGKLFDNTALGNMLEITKDTKEKDDLKLRNFIEMLYKESFIDTIGFYDLNWICHCYNMPQIPKKKDVIDSINEAGFIASETHIKPNSIRSNIGIKDLVKIMRELTN